MMCPACGAAMHVATGKDYLICDYCGTTHFPDPNPDGVRVARRAHGFPVPTLQCRVSNKHHRRCAYPLLQSVSWRC